MQRLRALALGVAVSGCFTAAQAQMFNNFAGQMLMSRQALAPVRGLQLRNSPSSGFTTSHGGGRRVGGASAPIMQARTNFPRDRAVSAQARAAFVDSMRQQFGPDTARAVATDLERNDFIQLWNRVVGSDGFRDDDMADALAAYIGLNWNIANRGDLDTAQLTTLRRAVHNAMGADPMVVRMSAAQRQIFADELIFIFDYLAKGYNDAQHGKDPGKLTELSNLAQSRMRAEMSLNMRAMRIGANGAITNG